MVPATQFGSKAKVLENLRHLLRVTRKRSSHETQLEDSSVENEQFRERQAEVNPQKINAYLEEAVDAATMLNGVEEQKYLWFLDTGAEKQLTSQEIVRRSAHRVGLIIPDALANPDHHSLSDAKEKARIYTIQQNQIKNQ